AARNREAWALEAASYAASAERNWARSEFSWGILDAPESELALLGEVEGKEVVELAAGRRTCRRGSHDKGASGRRGRHRGAARHRAADAARARVGVPARLRQRRGRASAGRLVRPRRLR